MKPAAHPVMRGFASNAGDNGPTPGAGPPLHWRAMTATDIDLVLTIEKAAHAHPWRARHFEDSLQAGHWSRVLERDPDSAHVPPSWVQAPRSIAGRWLLGYLIAMPGVGEAHLLNITVAPLHRRCGWGRWMLRALRAWAADSGAQQLWLEVRASNHSARQLYLSEGWQEVGIRRGYYPDSATRREDAIVMRCALGQRTPPVPAP